MNNGKPGIYAYLRVSTDKQDLDNQRHGINDYANKHGFGPITFFEDTVSGTKEWEDREIGRLLHKQAKAGDIILTAEFSRLGRSTMQVLLILEAAAKKGVIVHIVKNNLVMDGSLNSKMIAYCFGMGAEIERDFISKRTSEAIARRKAEGKPVGRQKGSTNESKKLDKHKDQITEWLELGVTKTRIAEKLNCSTVTLYKWMEENGFERYVKEKPGRWKSEDKPAPATTPIPGSGRRGRKAAAAGARA